MDNSANPNATSSSSTFKTFSQRVAANEGTAEEDAMDEAYVQEKLNYMLKNNKIGPIMRNTSAHRRDFAEKEKADAGAAGAGT